MLHPHTYLRAVLLVAVVGLSLASESGNLYSPNEKAYYADAQTVQFVRPGLTITITSAAIAADGTITVNYTLTDPGSLPLDNLGVTTPGTISVSFIAAVLPKTQDEYLAYTTRAATGTVIASTNQPGADSGGVVTQVAAGQYQYVFKTKAPSGFDATATHTIAAYGSRNLTTYGLNTYYASTTYNFVPNGAKVTKVHEIVKSAACNSCHDQLSAHGGSRRGVELCVVCHTSQNTDPNTGLSVNARVFFHKLHEGSSLPSVVAGTPYVPAKNSFGTFDYSAVVFPADVRHCETCHSQTVGAAEAKNYLTNPSRLVCGSCHDDVNFATGKNHAGGIQVDDSQCATCHIPQGTQDFDASIKGAHVIPTESSLLSGLNVALTKVQNGTAGSAPVVTFQITDNNNKPVAVSALGSLSLTMAGPTTDYGYTSFGSDVTTPGYVTESATGATCGSDGTCLYTFKHAVPAKAKGTYAIGVEARRTETILANTPKQQSVQYGAKNQVIYFSVDGSPVASRRAVVATANCQACHVALNLHGGLRNQTEYCVMCHNPSNTDVSVRSSATVASDKALPPQGINFNLLVHRIHFGVNQDPTRPYIVVGYGGSHNDFSGTLYPPMSPTGSAGDTRNCNICHVNTSQLNLPLGKNAVTDPQGPINPIQAIASACTGCHMSIDTASHALVNTTQLGESCTVCHKSGADDAVDKVHAQY